MRRPKPCTLANRHSWEFVRNVTTSRVTINQSGSRAHISFRGLYRCECGEQRYGIQRAEP